QAPPLFPYTTLFRSAKAGGDKPRRSPTGGTVVGLHGIQSHGGWYLESCRRIADAGYDVVFLERRGCGLNDRDRGDAPSFRRLLRSEEHTSELQSRGH